MNRARFAATSLTVIVFAMSGVTSLAAVGCSTSSVHPEPFGDCNVTPCGYSAPSGTKGGGGSTTGGTKTDSGGGGTTGGGTTGGAGDSGAGTTGGAGDSGAGDSGTGSNDAAARD